MCGCCLVSIYKSSHFNSSSQPTPQNSVGFYLAAPSSTWYQLNPTPQPPRLGLFRGTGGESERWSNLRFKWTKAGSELGLLFTLGAPLVMRVYPSCLHVLWTWRRHSAMFLEVHCGGELCGSTVMSHSIPQEVLELDCQHRPLSFILFITYRQNFSVQPGGGGIPSLLFEAEVVPLASYRCDLQLSLERFAANTKQLSSNISGSGSWVREEWSVRLTDRWGFSSVADSDVVKKSWAVRQTSVRLRFYLCLWPQTLDRDHRTSEFSRRDSE